MSQLSGASASTTTSKARITIRRATIKDLRPVVKIWLDAVQIGMGLTPPSSDEVLNTFQKRLESPPAASSAYGHWVAEVDGDVAGWQGLHPCRPNPMMRWAESGTYISMQYLGQGIGEALVKFATEHVKSTDLTHLVGFLGARNEAMLKAVESFGWQRVGSVPRAKSSDPEVLYYVYPVPHR